MVHEDSPRFELPAIIFSQSEQAAFEDIEPLRSIEEVLLVQSRTRDHVNAIRTESMYWSVRPVFDLIHT
jgi:hypothetical protein